jgi:hypothetical protein
MGLPPVLSRGRGGKSKRTRTTGLPAEFLPVEDQGDAGLPAEQPPAEPPDQPVEGGSARDDHSVTIVHDMVKTAIDLQYQIAERIDSKVRVYFGAAVTMYTAVQVIVLKDDVIASSQTRQTPWPGLRLRRRCCSSSRSA